MTTRVLIVNHGPDPVDAHLIADEPLDESQSHSAGSVAPQQQREFYVYQGTSLLLKERKRT